MPTYEYVCRDCARHLEVVQSFTDEPLKECGTCGGALRKVFSAAGIIFKGSGYYVTDTRSDRRATTSVDRADGKKDKDSGGDAGTSSDKGTTTSDSASSSDTSAKSA